MVVINTVSNVMQKKNMHPTKCKFSAEPVPMSACGGNSKNLKDLKESFSDESCMGVQGSGLRVWGLGCMVEGLGPRVEGSGLRVSGFDLESRV